VSAYTAEPMRHGADGIDAMETLVICMYLCIAGFG
jgi:hypothetical protein